MILLSSNAAYLGVISGFTWVTGGLDKEAGLYFKYNTGGKSNLNIRMLPYTSQYLKASDVVLDIEGNTYSANRINNVSIWNPVSQSYRTYLHNGSRWVAPDDPILPGEAILIGLSGVTSEFTWSPKLIMTPVP